MKTRTVTERIGELLGPVDWSYDFRQHFGGTSDARIDELCAEAVATLRLLADHPDDYEVTTDGGWPSCGWGRIVAVGMYDGWPYWRPVPSVCISGTFGGEWSAFSNITSIKKKATP
jgi:hypothetical protein